MFLVLRKLARSGAATIRMSSALIKARLVQPAHWWGTSRTMQGIVVRSVSKIESKASAPKSYTRSRVAGAASRLRWSVHFDSRRSIKAVSTRSGENTASAMPCGGARLLLRAAGAEGGGGGGGPGNPAKGRAGAPTPVWGPGGGGPPPP